MTKMKTQILRRTDRQQLKSFNIVNTHYSRIPYLQIYFLKLTCKTKINTCSALVTFGGPTCEMCVYISPRSNCSVFVNLVSMSTDVTTRNNENWLLNSQLTYVIKGPLNILEMQGNKTLIGLKHVNKLLMP